MSEAYYHFLYGIPYMYMYITEHGNGIDKAQAFISTRSKINHLLGVPLCQ